MADNKTIPEKPVTIENVGKVSTNFYWTYDYNGQVFNNQTTIRDDVSLEMVKQNIKTTLEAQAHVLELGGQAKPVGQQPAQPAATLPVPTPLSEIPSYVAPGEDVPFVPEPEAPPDAAELPAQTPAQPAAPAKPAVPGAITFRATEMTLRTEGNKRYFKIKGEPPFHLYGVTVWDEVLNAAGIPAASLSEPTYNMKEYVATVESVTNKKGETRQKVTRLQKVA